MKQVRWLVVVAALVALSGCSAVKGIIPGLGSPGGPLASGDLSVATREACKAAAKQDPAAAEKGAGYVAQIEAAATACLQGYADGLPPPPAPAP